MDKFSTGILTRPSDHSTLVISIKNNLSCLVFKTIYVYSWDSSSPVLISINNYFISANGTYEINIPLICEEYSDTYYINKFEVVYEPCDCQVTAMVSTK